MTLVYILTFLIAFYVFFLLCAIAGSGGSRSPGELLTMALKGAIWIILMAACLTTILWAVASFATY